MGCLEENHIQSTHPFSSSIYLYKRYIDDLFFLWTGSEEEAADFTKYLNSNHWGITFTPNFNPVQIEFLAFLITQENNRVLTSTYFKQVDSNIWISQVDTMKNGRKMSLLANSVGYGKIVQKMQNLRSKPKSSKRGLKKRATPKAL